MAGGMFHDTKDKATCFQLGLFANAWTGSRERLLQAQNASLRDRSGLPQPGESPLLALSCWDVMDPTGAGLREAVASQLASLQVHQWNKDDFVDARKIQDARRSNGTVFAMLDKQSGRYKAVKEVNWTEARNEMGACTAQEELMFGLACATYLEMQHYPYNCPIRGVFDDSSTGVRRVVMDLAGRGDLFALCSRLPTPGPQREALVLPLVVQALDSVRCLHELGFVHGDISMENFLVGDDGRLRLIDFGRASCGRWISPDRRPSSKPSYRAPEEFAGVIFDGQAADTFSLGVLAYALLVNDYPWLSTKPQGCRWFDHFQHQGFRTFVARRKVRGKGSVATVLSEPALQLLEGLLQIDPLQRLNLQRASTPTGDDANNTGKGNVGSSIGSDGGITKNNVVEADQQQQQQQLTVWDSLWLQSQADTPATAGMLPEQLRLNDGSQPQQQPNNTNAKVEERAVALAAKKEDNSIITTGGDHHHGQEHEHEHEHDQCHNKGFNALNLPEEDTHSCSSGASDTEESRPPSKELPPRPNSSNNNNEDNKNDSISSSNNNNNIDDSTSGSAEPLPLMQAVPSTQRRLQRKSVSGSSQSAATAAAGQAPSGGSYRLAACL